MSSVTINAVSKTYKGALKRGDFTAIEGVSFAIPNGAFCVLVGPSGCGKSTLLRMVAGLEEITKGEISIGERVVNDLEPMERDIAFVFQNYALYPHMSVYDNMAYGLKNRGMAKAEIATRVAEAATILELDGLLQRKPRELSGGQRQRVAMGRAIVRQPQVFLFDEPLSNLDAKLRISMRIEIKKLQRSLGVTSIYVTHDQLEAMTLADILVVMNKGKVEQIGSPLEIYHKPQTLFAATFIGAPPMNIIKRDTLLGFRPEHIRLGAGEGHSFTFTPTLIEPIGAESYVYGQDEAGNEITLRIAESGEISLDKPFICHVDAGHLHRFDEKTHQRV